MPLDTLTLTPTPPPACDGDLESTSLSGDGWLLPLVGLGSCRKRGVELNPGSDVACVEGLDAYEVIDSRSCVSSINSSLLALITGVSDAGRGGRAGGVPTVPAPADVGVLLRGGGGGMRSHGLIVLPLPPISSVYVGSRWKDSVVNDGCSSVVE